MCDQTTNTTGQIKASKIKVYAVTSTKRVASLPDVPTAAEAGLAGLRGRRLARPLRAEGHAESGHRQTRRVRSGRRQGPG